MAHCTHLLIAEDGARSRGGLRALLDSMPDLQVVCEASNGREAVRLTEQCRPDVVLMDVRMPVLNGIEATRLVKSRWPHIRVVVLTVHAAHRAEALAAGADGFLIKGGPVDDLLEAISGPQRPRCGTTIKMSTAFAI